MPAQRVEIIGMDAVMERLNAFERKVRNKILSKAVRAGTKRVLVAFRQRIPKEIGKDGLARQRSGLMRRAAGVKIKTYRKSAVVVGIVGIRRGFKKAIGVRKKGKNKGQGIYYDPAKVFHLVEKGGKGMRAQAPLRRAVEAVRDAAAADVMRVVADESSKLT